MKKIDDQKGKKNLSSLFFAFLFLSRKTATKERKNNLSLYNSPSLLFLYPL